ncbi:spore germination protein GerW family protein [Nakamurella sp.]|uniref:spore germination protein GerW family protein n=1 Tax=Nakamurella sp. TaxID=1869182 RepID=UPI003782F7ED
MKLDELVNSTREALTVKRVYAEPFEKDGLAVIPAASVRGGAGGGSGHDEKGQEGEGGGFGMTGSPAGAYVVQGGKVKWLPAVDPNRLFVMVGLAVIAYLLMRPRMARARGPASS